MTRESLQTYDGITDVARQSKKIKSVSSWLPIYINYDEQRIKTEKESDRDYFLTELIRPCTKKEVMDTIITMLSY